MKREIEQVPSYEELRRRKLEENKKKLEELKIGHLSQTLRDALTPKTSLAKRVKRKAPPQERDSVAVRRSDRLANLPPANYKEVESKKADYEEVDLDSDSDTSEISRSSVNYVENKETHSVVVRRSDRVSNLPHANYTEVDLDYDSDTSERSIRISKRRDLSGREHTSESSDDSS